MVKHSAKLSAADQVCPMVHNPCLVAYKNDNPDKAYHLLAEGLRRMVRYLPWLSGYIARGEQGYTHLVWDDNVTGDEVKLERVDARNILPSFDELMAGGMNLQDYDYDFPLTHMCTREFQPTPREPAMLIGFYEVRGGFIYKFAIHHHMVDAQGLFTMVLTWAAMTAGREPDIELDPRHPMTRYDDLRDAADLEPSPHHVNSLTSGPDVDLAPKDAPAERMLAPFPSTGTVVQLTRKLFTLSQSSLEELRDLISKETTGKRPSLMAVVASLFWCLVNEVREQRGVSQPASDGDPPRSSLLMAANARPSFPKIDPFFLGNFITPAFATEPLSAIVASPRSPNLSANYAAALARGCDAIGPATNAAVDPDFIRPKLQAILNFPDARLLAGAGGNPMGANDIFLTSWMHLSTYPDFGPGIGVHEACRPGPTGRTTERATYSYLVILPRRVGSDGQQIYEVFACFEKGDMEALEAHPFLQKYLYKLPVFQK